MSRRPMVQPGEDDFVQKGSRYIAPGRCTQDDSIWEPLNTFDFPQNMYERNEGLRNALHISVSFFYVFISSNVQVDNNVSIRLS